MADTLPDDEEPLDPAMLRVQAKLRRLMFFGGGTLIVGILAVLLAVVYRLAVSDTGGLPVGATVTLTLPDMKLPGDARLVSTAADAGRLLLTYAHAGGATVIVLDSRKMAVIGRLELPAGP